MLMLLPLPPQHLLPVKLKLASHKKKFWLAFSSVLRLLCAARDPLCGCSLLAGQQNTFKRSSKLEALGAHDLQQSPPELRGSTCDMFMAAADSCWLSFGSRTASRQSLQSHNADMAVACTLFGSLWAPVRPLLRR